MNLARTYDSKIYPTLYLNTQNGGFNMYVSCTI